MKNIKNRLVDTYWRHKRELRSVSQLPFDLKRSFYFYYLLRIYINLPFHLPLRPKHSNMFYHQKDLITFAPDLYRMRLFDERLRDLVGEFSIKGVRSWEYGKLLSLIDLESMPTILDVGPGSSTFPYYLASKGAEVITIDLPIPMERSWNFQGDLHDIHHVRGTVLNLPFSDNSFEMVTCISTIEHLDTDYPKKFQVPYAEFIRRTRRALAEMVRVLKKGGNLFLTTDVYLPGQKTDRWKTDVQYKGIGGAFQFDDLENVFLKTIRNSGCKLVYETDYSVSKLIDNVHHSNYRGRYFTTFALWCEKVK